MPPREHGSLGVGDFEISVGSGADCRIVISDAPDEAARLARRGDRLFLKGLGAGAATLVNGTRLPEQQWQEVTRFDEVMVGGTILDISPKVFLGRDRVGLGTTLLRYALPGQPATLLCDGAFLRAEPGSLTAIMGLAGSGKTVLLNLLNGYLRPDEGLVVVGETFDLHEDYWRIRDFIGYVPQDDVMIPELTVRQSLHYRLSLRFPDMVLAVRDRLIRETCRQLGLHASRVDRFLDTRIGSVESGRRGLSGGGRKRANIAHELISRPLILLLDEPTSSLSSVDAHQVVLLLRNLATLEALTVVTTIHQPSAEAFALFDFLLIMTHGGRVVYYGPRSEAVAYMERETDVRCAPDRNPAEYILDQVADPRLGRQLADRLPELRRTSPSMPMPLEPPTSASAAHAGPRRRLGDRLHLRSLLAQIKVLTRRNLSVLLADKPNLALVFGQVPLIATLVLLAFTSFQSDGRGYEGFARTVHRFHELKREYDVDGRPAPLYKLTRQAAEESATTGGLISQLQAQRRGTVYFVLVAASIWLSILGSCREVVSELHVLRRESRTCLNLPPYLFAKLLVQILITGIQSGLLSLLVSPFLLDLHLGSALALWGVLWLVSVTAASFGLLVSCCAPTYRFALTAVPLLMIPQLVFGGLLRSEADVAETVVLPRALSALTIQRWGFESALAVDPYADGNVLIQDFSSQLANREVDLDYATFRNASLPEVFFRVREWGRGWLPLCCLFFGAAGLMGVSCIVLQQKLLR